MKPILNTEWNEYKSWIFAFICGMLFQTSVNTGVTELKCHTGPCNIVVMHYSGIRYNSTHIIITLLQVIESLQLFAIVWHMLMF